MALVLVVLILAELDGVNNTFQQFVKKIVNNGEKTLFWIDSWINGSPLATSFPRLYSLTFNKNVSASEMKTRGWGASGLERPCGVKLLVILML